MRRSAPAPVPRRAKRQPTIKAYAVIARAVEEGLACGWRRAHKHTDTPDGAHVLEQMEMAVMSALDEVLEFGA